jgi:hypothetical protein
MSTIKHIFCCFNAKGTMANTCLGSFDNMAKNKVPFICCFNPQGAKASIARAAPLSLVPWAVGQ